MAALNDPLVPDRITSQDFGTSFRGFDQAEVRGYLQQLADAVRTEQQAISDSMAGFEDQSAQIEKLERRVETQAADAEKLTQELKKARASFANLKPTSEKVLPTDLDAGQINQLLGEETVRVLDSARSAAADITAKAEKDSKDRSAALDKLERETTARLAKEQKSAEKEAATLRADAQAEAKSVMQKAESEATKLQDEASAAADKLRSDAKTESGKLNKDAAAAAAASKIAAQDVADAVKQRGEEVAKQTRLTAESDGESIRKAAEQVKSDAEAEGARLRAEAAADVETARDAAREEARLMLTEAQTLREKVLEDLVKRRRIARQQIDQAKAARDRLARALIVARKQVDAATSELDISIPEAKRAMELAGLRSSGTEAEQMANIAQGLDSARSKGQTLSAERVAYPSEVGTGVKPKRKRTADGKPKMSKEASKQTALADGSPKESKEDLVVDLDDGGVEAEVGDDLDDIFARIRAERSDPEGAANESVAKADPAPAKPVVSDPAPAKAKPSQAKPVVGNPAEGESSDSNSSDTDTAETIEVLAPFTDRDVASTRVGPDLRRKLKRALADDQSDVLDRLRRAKKVSSDDLPAIEEQLSGFRKAAEPGLLALATSGSKSLGGPKVSNTKISGLLDRLAKDVQGPLRAKIERAVSATDGDGETLLEPVRAHYRDVRSVELPALIEDAMAEAFALGVYEAIAAKAKVVWVVDPRTETSADCFDNTLEDSGFKQKAFPTGHQRPLGGPGCRCLVLPADQFGSSS